MGVFYLATEIGVNAAGSLRQSLSGLGGERPNNNPRAAGWHRTCRAQGMANILDFINLICALVGAMAFGILSAYAILRVCFFLMRPARRPTAVKPEPETAALS